MTLFQSYFYCHSHPPPHNLILPCWVPAGLGPAPHSPNKHCTLTFWSSVDFMLGKESRPLISWLRSCLPDTAVIFSLSTITCSCSEMAATFRRPHAMSMDELFHFDSLTQSVECWGKLQGSSKGKNPMDDRGWGGGLNSVGSQWGLLSYWHL